MATLNAQKLRERWILNHMLQVLLVPHRARQNFISKLEGKKIFFSKSIRFLILTNSGEKKSSFVLVWLQKQLVACHLYENFLIFHFSILWESCCVKWSRAYPILCGVSNLTTRKCQVTSTRRRFWHNSSTPVCWRPYVLGGRDSLIGYLSKSLLIGKRPYVLGDRESLIGCLSRSLLIGKIWAIKLLNKKNEERIKFSCCSSMT